MTERSQIKEKIRRRVMVVDDEMINRQLLGYIVSRDYDVIYAENGVEALSKVKNEKEMISLILLDLIMPGMDGYEFLSVIQSDPELRRIPVIVLTSEKNAEVKCLRLGAVDFIPKPYDMPDVILARVGRSIELSEGSKIINDTENDIISGLYIRQYFYRYCERHDKYFPGIPMDAVALNINRFHFLNEIYGRSYGDKVLGMIGHEIRRLLKNKSGMACRSDADSFYIYIEHQDDYDGIIDELAGRIWDSAGNDHINLRMGIYSFADTELNIEERFDRAFHACNPIKSIQKAGYKNHLAYYDDSMHEKELFSEKLLSEMDNAIRERQFKVHYQPKYNIKGDRPVLKSAEALIRWQHPEFGFISPGVFIPLFEENGLIHKLDKYVWREAAHQIREWKDSFDITLPVSVNVSRVDLFDPDLGDELLNIAGESDIDPSECFLEITESAYTDNSSQMISTVQSLREKGFHIEMDDFGSGYSSLNMLASMPIDALKLDMVFVQNICEDKKNARMVEIMIDIASFLSVPVIAEGVEKEEQYRLLKELGCDIIQGYYFSKPVPPEKFADLIEKEISLSK